MTLTDEIAAKMMGEIGVVTRQIDDQLARMEKIVQEVRTVAREVNSGKSSLHSQSETHLKNQLALLSNVAKSLNNSEELLRKSGPQDARVLLTPLIEEMGKHVRTLSDKHSWAAQLMISANKVQNDITAKLFYAVIIGILLFVGGGALGYLIGRSGH